MSDLSKVTRQIENNKPVWYRTYPNNQTFQVSRFDNEDLEQAYQLVLQSHPAPPDLLTEQFKLSYEDNPSGDLSIWAEINGKKVKIFTDEWLRSTSHYSHQQDLEIAKYIVNLSSQLSKLQQARPTEQVREKIARMIAILRGLNLWEYLPDKQTKECGLACKEACFRSADQILRLLPDEQGIRNGVADYIEAVIKQIREANKKLTGDKAFEAQAITKVFLDNTMQVLADSIRQDDMTIQENGQTVWTLKTGWIIPVQSGKAPGEGK